MCAALRSPALSMCFWQEGLRGWVAATPRPGPCCWPMGSTAAQQSCKSAPPGARRHCALQRRRRRNPPAPPALPIPPRRLCEQLLFRPVSLRGGEEAILHPQSWAQEKEILLKYVRVLCQVSLLAGGNAAVERAWQRQRQGNWRVCVRA